MFGAKNEGDCPQALWISGLTDRSPRACMIDPTADESTDRIIAAHEANEVTTWSGVEGIGTTEYSSAILTDKEM